MQDLRELLRQREKQCEQLQKEIDALRITITILETEDTTASDRKVESTAMMPPNGNGSGRYAAATAPKQFP